MNQINFNVSLNADSREALLAASEFLAKLAAVEYEYNRKPYSAEVEVTEKAPIKKIKTEPVKTEPAKTEPVKTEPVKTEPVKTEPVKTSTIATPEEVDQGTEDKITKEEIRALGTKKALANPEVKALIKAWIDKRDIKNVPSIPEELYSEYVTFLNTL